MSSSKKMIAPPKEEKNQSTKFVAFNSVTVFSSKSGVTVKTKNFTLHTQIMLYVQSLLWGIAGEVSISKIQMMWCPLVEPGALSSVNMTVKYDVGEDEADITTNQTILKVCGRISEYIVVTIHPSVPIVKDSDKAFYNPWQLDVDTDEVAPDGQQHALGIVKIWCRIKVKMFSPSIRASIKEYRTPDVAWTNINYPYYVPYFIKRNVRGLGAICWRDTEQYKTFKSDVIAHIDGSVVKPDQHLFLMQIISKDDVTHLFNLVKNCHLLKGGTCTCGDVPTQYVASMMQNNTGSCRDHGKRFDDYCTAIITGKLKYIDETLSMKF